MNSKELTYEDKIAYLCGDKDKINFSDGKYEKIIFADDMSEETDEYVFHPELLADTWDTDLVKETAALVAGKAKERGVTAMVLPSLAPRTTPIGEGASEDNYHICSLFSAAAEGLLSVGVKPIISDLGITKAMLTGDAVYDKKAIADEFIKPLAKFKRGDYFPAVAYGVKDDETFGISRLIKSTIATPEYESCATASGRDAVEQIKNGRAVLKGNGKFAQNAYENYKQCNVRLRKGLISETEVKNLEERNETLDERSIDNAFKLLEDYARKESDDLQTVNLPPAEEVYKRLARESVVMLKNDDSVLPLSKILKVAVVGRCEADDFAARLTAAGANAEYFGGYEAKSEDTVLLGSDELKKISACDAIVFFIDNARRKGSASALPSNRLAALDTLKTLNKKIIAVAIGNKPVDMSFDEDCDGLLLVRGKCKYLGNALEEILFGEVNPTGRLAISLFDEAEEYYESLRRDEVLADTKSGTFFGYKYYLSSGKKIKYPFGFGLSYNKCAYSVTKTDAGQVLISVSNTTSDNACEIFQVYLANKNAGCPHPKKELIAFSRVNLKPHESLTTRVVIEKNSFAFYSPDKDKFVTEKGIYDLYAGISAADDGKVEFVEKAGIPPVKTDITEADVLPWKSNIVSDGYSMEEGENLMKNSKKLSLTAWILLFATILTDVAVAVLWIANGLQADVYATWFVLLASALVLNHIILIVALCILINVKKRNREVESLLKKVREEKFSDATVLKNDCAQDVFKVVAAPEVKEEEIAVAEEKTYVAFDKTIKFSDICDSLKAYLSASGYSVRADEVRSIVASFASSRLIITEARDHRADILHSAVKFFGANSFFANIKTDDPDEILLNEDFTLAVDCASKARDEIVFCILTGITAKKCNNAFLKLLSYFEFPESGRVIYYGCNGEEKKIVLPPNMWFIVVLGEDAAVGAISKEVLNCAQTLFIEAEEKQTEEIVEPDKAMGYNQFITMAAVAKDKYCANEETWKRVDNLEKAFYDYSFRLDNKDWQIMESFSAVFLSAGGDENEMTDYLISERIIPSIYSYSDDLQNNDKSLKDVVESACGEEYSDKIAFTLKDLDSAQTEEGTEKTNSDGTTETVQNESVNIRIDDAAVSDQEFMPETETVRAYSGDESKAERAEE